MNLIATDPTRRLPDYETGNFAHIPGLLQALLGVETDTPLSPERFGYQPGQFQKVIFLFLDAFGWNVYSYFLNRRNRILGRLTDKGQVLKITSQFPSTTAAHVTTFSTGQVVGQHGVYEWQYYEPEVDDVIVPLLFSYAGEKQRGTLRDAYIDPRDILPNRTVFQDLQDAGIPTYSFVPREYIKTAYNQVMAQGSEARGYYTLAEGLTTLKRKVNKSEGAALFYFYTPFIDALAHKNGPFSYQSLAEADATLLLLDKYLLHPLRGRDDTLIVISADHGQVRVDYRSTFYINLQPEFQELRCYLRANKRGKILTPGGSPRDVFLYVREEYVGRAQSLLRRMLGGRADVLRTQQLIDAGLFGVTEPSPDFMKRVGNLVILPHGDETVWWYEKDKLELKLNGLHGGLSRDEMEIPLILYRP
jgi:predicted AlkP superfamily pyrophosphatase or phosphodiesterase